MTSSGRAGVPPQWTGTSGTGHGAADCTELFKLGGAHARERKAMPKRMQGVMHFVIHAVQEAYCRMAENVRYEIHIVSLRLGSEATRVAFVLCDT